VQEENRFLLIIITNGCGCSAMRSIKVAIRSGPVAVAKKIDTHLG
jgi:hypothetical protein